MRTKHGCAEELEFLGRTPENYKASKKNSRRHVISLSHCQTILLLVCAAADPKKKKSDPVSL